MKRVLWYGLTACLLLGPAVSSTACAGNALVSTSPTQEEVQRVRQASARIADGVRTAIEIVRAAGLFIDSLAISDDIKNDFDRSIVAVMGTSEAPGPMVAGLTALGTATVEPELQATVTAILIHKT